MAILTNTVQTYDRKGLRESLSNMIYNISPTEVPFMSNAGRGSAKATLEEWQTDALAAVDTANRAIEGDDITTFPSDSATTRVGNYLQISRKLVIVSDTVEEVDKAGRKSEEALQLAKRAKELKRDMEAICLDNQAGSAGSSSTGRQIATLGAWAKTNVDKDAGGTNPTYTTGVPNAARTDGTVRTFTETILKAVMQSCFNNGANPDTLMVGPFNKGIVSAFTGIATKTIQQTAVKASAIIGAADFYVSDFGTLAVVANRFQRERDAWFLDFSYVSVAFLRKFRTTKLAKTGDAEKRMIVAEWTLKVHNEAALGLAADLKTS
jgi:hypothetical protein